MLRQAIHALLAVVLSCAAPALAQSAPPHVTTANYDDGVLIVTWSCATSADGTQSTYSGTLDMQVPAAIEGHTNDYVWTIDRSKASGGYALTALHSFKPNPGAGPSSLGSAATYNRVPLQDVSSVPCRQPSSFYIFKLPLDTTKLHGPNGSVDGYLISDGTEIPLR